MNKLRFMLSAFLLIFTALELSGLPYVIVYQKWNDPAILELGSPYDESLIECAMIASAYSAIFMGTLMLFYALPMNLKVAQYSLGLVIFGTILLVFIAFLKIPRPEWTIKL